MVDGLARRPAGALERRRGQRPRRRRSSPAAIRPAACFRPSRVLCRSFDVSRSVVREAMKALEEKGLARARQGHGTTITPPDEWNLLDPIVLEATIRADETMQILDQLVDVRAALESDMARAAAHSMSDADLAELGRCWTSCTARSRTPSATRRPTPAITTSSCAAPAIGSAAPSSARSIPTRGRAPGTTLRPTKQDIRQAHAGTSRSTSTCPARRGRRRRGDAGAHQRHVDAAQGQTRLTACSSFAHRSGR